MKKTLATVLGSVIGLAPLVVLAHSGADATSSVGALHAPANVDSSASELASFVLSAVALVVAGIALARTRRHSHSHHNVQ